MKIVSKSIVFCMTNLIALSLNLSAPLNAAWNPTVIVDAPSNGVSTGPVLSVNASNNGVGVWSAQTPLFPDRRIFDDIYAASYTFGSGWGLPVTISDASLYPNGERKYTSQGDPDVRMNASGYAIAVWEGDSRDLQANLELGIFSATRSSSGVWSSVQRVSALNLTDPDFDPVNPTVAVNDPGLGVAVWYEALFSNVYIMTSFLPFGGTWTPPVELDNLGTFSQPEQPPEVAINANGNVVATWYSRANTGNFIISAATYDPLTSLWTTVILDSNPDTSSQPITGIDDKGNAVAVWVRQVGPNPQIVASSFTIGTGWGTPVVLDQGNFDIFVDNPYVVMDHFGTATAVWNSNKTGTDQVFSSTLPLGETWSAPTQISTTGQNGVFVPLTPVLADVDDLGNVIVIIYSDSGIQSVLKTIQGGWQPPESIDNNPRSRNQINIGIGSCGFALSLWSQGPGFGQPTSIAASDNLELLNYLSPPSNFVGLRCCNKFATQKSCLNRLSWTADECAASYVLRRNGVIIATIPAGGSTSFEDPVCGKNPSVYTLSVISGNGVESPGISITLP